MHYIFCTFRHIDYISHMKIFTATQIKACDAFTLAASRISSSDLMERAADKCTTWIREHFPKDSLFIALCGTGNNGGDGLAIARQLHQKGYGVKAFVLDSGKELSADCKQNVQRLRILDESLLTMVAPENFITDLPANIIIIDAIFGTGLSRPVQGWLAKFIQHINALPNRKIAIDMPSGLPADLIPDKDAMIMNATHTLSFQFCKRSFLHPEAGSHTGSIHILDIGLSKDYIKATTTQYNTIGREDILAIYKPRPLFAHKGNFGSVLLAGGSHGKIGAISLSTRAALKAGAGLVTALVPECGYSIMQTAVPEAMCRINGTNAFNRIGDTADFTAVGVGPGMGTDATTVEAFTTFIEGCTRPVVLDADALNIIGMHKDLLGKLPKDSVLTPHPKEFSRMFGENTNSMIQLDHARIQAMRYNVNIVLKGHHTAVITSEGDCWYNMTGNPGMATGGAGDVLTGVITGLLAQGYAPHEAAILGVYLHGLAGDLAAKELSMEALVAGDIIDHLGKAFLTLK